MSPAQQEAMWTGWQWRRSRDIELLSKTILWLLAPHVKEGSVDFDGVTKSLPGYDMAFQKSLQIDKPLEAPWKRVSKKKKKR